MSVLQYHLPVMNKKIIFTYKRIIGMMNKKIIFTYKRIIGKVSLCGGPLPSDF